MWFYRDRVGNCRGPAPLNTLRQCWVNGIVDEHTMVWGNGLSDWVPARNVRGLISNIRNPPTIIMHWLMRKFVDTLRGEEVSRWSKRRDREMRDGPGQVLGSLTLNTVKRV